MTNLPKSYKTPWSLKQSILFAIYGDVCTCCREIKTQKLLAVCLKFYLKPWLRRQNVICDTHKAGFTLEKDETMLGVSS